MKKIKKMRFGGMASSSKGPGGGMMGGSGSGGPSSKPSSGGRTSAPSGGKTGGMSSASSSGRASGPTSGKSAGRGPQKYAKGGIVNAPAKSYKDMRAGAGSGVGRIQKMKIAGRGR